MSKHIGFIEILSGEGSMISATGEERTLAQGMQLSEDDILATGPNANIIIQLDGGGTLTIGANQVLTLDQSVVSKEGFDPDETQAEVDALQEILAEDPNLSVFEETASGEAVAVGGSSLIIDSVEKHTDNRGTTKASTLQQFEDNLIKDTLEDDDTILVAFDTNAAFITLNDILTNDNTPIVSGTTNDPDARIVINVDGNDYVANNNGDGTWSITVDQPVADGETTITVVATDPAGNVSQEEATLIVDTIAPVITIDTTPTNDTTPTIQGTVDDPTATITITINGTEYTPTITPDGNGGYTWSLEDNEVGTLDEGETIIKVVAEDSAGNITEVIDNITIDTNNNDNNGNGNTDSGEDATITLHDISGNYINSNETTQDLLIEGTSTAKEGSVVIIEIAGADGIAHNINTFLDPSPTITVDDQGHFEVTFVATAFTQFEDGVYTVTASVEADIAGNLISDTQVVTLDTTLSDDVNNGGDGDNGGALVTIDSVEDNTGLLDVSSAIVTTDDKTVIIKGTFDNEDDTRLIIKIDGNVYEPVIDGKNWTLDLSDLPLTAQNHVISATIVDTAGNNEQVALELVITPVTGTLHIEGITDDTGVSSADFITTDDTLIINGSMVDPINNDLSITVGANSYGTADSELTINSDGTWILDLTAISLGSDATNTITVTETEAGTGITQSVSQDVITDNSTPDDSNNSNNGNVVTIDSITEDTGLSDSDFITTDTTLIIRGTFDNEQGNTLRITINNEAYTPTISGNDWSIDLQNTTFADGLYTVNATVSDVAGNEVTVTQAIDIDTRNDNGSGEGGNTVDGSDAVILLHEISDNFINAQETAQSVTINGTTTALDNSTVSIYVDGTLLTTTTSMNGLFSYDVPQNTFNAYADGLYEVRAEVVADLAGNIASDTQNVILDTSSSDNGDGGSGGNGTDGSDATITLDENLFGDSIINTEESQRDTLAITGSTNAIDGTLITIEIDGVTFAQSYAENGRFSVTIEPIIFDAYPDGVYTLTALVEADAAGNTNSDSQTITLDRTIDNGGDYSGDNITIDSITEDSGVGAADDASRSDFITNDKNLTISGTYNNESGNTLVVSVGALTYSTALGNLNLFANSWSLDTQTLDEGATTITATITDSAGNSEVITQEITIDSIADTGDGTTQATITLDPISEGYINAQEAGNLLTLQGTSNVIGAEVIITLNGGDFTSATVQADGSYSATVDTTVISSFPDGDYLVQATIITDTAGNSVSADQLVVLDTTLDANDDYNGANITIDAISDDTGTAGDYITADTSLMISGSFNAEDGNSVVIIVDNVSYDASSTELSLDSATNSWNLDLQGVSLTTGVYTITAIVKDSAGNSESTNQELSIVESTDLGVINLNEISGNFINLEESQNDLEITGVSTAIGQTVNFEINNTPLIINGIAITAVVSADGTFSTTIAANTFDSYVDGVYDVKASVIDTNGILFSDTENVTLDRSNSDDNGTGTGTDGSDATIILDAVGDGFINAQEADNGLLLTGTTTAVEGTVISFVFETLTGDKYPVTTTTNGLAITAGADGTFSAFISLGDLTGINNTNVTIIAEVVADQAGNIATSDAVSVTVDLSAGTLIDQTPTAVYESALELGSNPSLDTRSTSGNLFDGSSDTANSTITSISANGVEGSVWSENSNLFILDTPSGVTYVAINDTNVDGIDYVAGDFVYILQDASTATQDLIHYEMTDSAGNVSGADLNITIVDDTPMINPDGVVHKYLTSEVTGYTTNLILTLDVSGSMAWDADGTEDTSWNRFTGAFDPNTVRIDLAKDALNNMIDKYAELGDVNIQVISFSDTAVASEMLNAVDAKNYINSLTAGGGTNYDSAINLAQQDVALYPDANTTQYYFISDGQPNAGTGLDATEKARWDAYIANSPIDKTFAIGVGSNGYIGELDQISSGHGETIIINSITDLDSTLQQTVNNTIVTGEMTAFDADGTVVAVGADGGHISEVTLYNQDGSANITLLYDVNNPTQTISTPLGGTMTLNFDSGSYTYVIDYNNTLNGAIDKFDITVVDSDGDSVSNSVLIHLLQNPDENFSFDAVSTIDGKDGFDTIVLSGTETLDFSTISNLSNIEAIDMGTGDNTIVNLDLNDVLNMTDANNELFIYGEAGDSVTLDATLVTQNSTVTDANGKVFDVFSDVNATVTVNIEQEIVVS